MPLLSIVTVTFQAEEFIDRTVQSLLNQTSQAFEYIIIDGGSKDQTLRILDSYADRVNTLISKPDKGLYDAMNKGIRVAQGEYLWFMNAGDTLADERLIEDLIPILEQKPDVVYADAYFVNQVGQIRGLRSTLTPHVLPTTLHWRDMQKGMVVCHQSFIAKKEIVPEYVQNNLSADVDWEIKILKKASDIRFFPRPLSCYLEGGISNQLLKKSLMDRFIVLKNHFGWTTTLWSHVLILFRGLAKMGREGKKYW